MAIHEHILWWFTSLNGITLVHPLLLEESVLSMEHKPQILYCHSGDSAKKPAGEYSFSESAYHLLTLLMIDPIFNCFGADCFCFAQEYRMS